MQPCAINYRFIKCRTGPNAQPSQTDSLKWIYCSGDVVSCWLSVGHSDNEMEIGKASLEVQEKAEYIPQFSINHLALQTIMLDLCRCRAAHHCSTFINSINTSSRLLRFVSVNNIIKTVFCMQSAWSTYISIQSPYRACKSDWLMHIKCWKMEEGPWATCIWSQYSVLSRW